jgi:hypothetical protein
VGQAIDALAKHKAENTYFWLGLSPEGTRRLTPGWRSGFYQTALQADVLLALVKLDFGQRKVVALDFIQLTGDVAADMARIATVFEGVRGFKPSNASPIRIKEK